MNNTDLDISELLQNKLIINDNKKLLLNIFNESYNQLDNIISNWRNDHNNNLEQGKMRALRGKDIELFVISVLNNIINTFKLKNINVYNGYSNKQTLTLNHENIIIKKNIMLIYIYIKIILYLLLLNVKLI